MAKLLEIPQDVIDCVVAAVGDDSRLLKQCSLVSSSFLRPSRKQLFSSINLISDQTCQGIHQLLVKDPFIQSFVRTITVEENMECNMNGTSLLAILRLPFCHLECFTIRDPFQICWKWKNFSSELKDALSNIIHLSTLKTLSLRCIPGLPITFFTPIIHLTTLELHFFSPNDFDDENSNPLTWAASKGMAPMASHTVIDQCVWHFRQNYVHGTKFSS